MSLRFQTGDRCQVRARYDLNELSSRERLHRVLLQPGQRVEDLAGALWSDGRLLAATGAASRYEIRYSTRMVSDRVPLPVPERGFNGTLRLELELAPGLALTGTRFPAFRSVEGKYEASLNSFPSFVVATIRPADRVSWQDRFWSVDVVTDAAILFVVLVASALWWQRRSSSTTSGVR